MGSDVEAIPLTQALATSIETVISSRRIGEPVFVRWTARVAPGKQAIDAVGEAVAVISSWLADRPLQIHQFGESSAHAVAHALWSNGAAALVSAGPCLSGGRYGLDIMILGSSGAIYHDDQAVRRLDLAD